MRCESPTGGAGTVSAPAGTRSTPPHRFYARLPDHHPPGFPWMGPTASCPLVDRPLRLQRQGRHHSLSGRLGACGSSNAPRAPRGWDFRCVLARMRMAHNNPSAPQASSSGTTILPCVQEPIPPSPPNAPPRPSRKDFHCTQPLPASSATKEGALMRCCSFPPPSPSQLTEATGSDAM